LDGDPPIYVSHIAGKAVVHHHAQLLLVEMGSQKLFAHASL
jgi:hypothetical protein